MRRGERGQDNFKISDDTRQDIIYIFEMANEFEYFSASSCHDNTLQQRSQPLRRGRSHHATIQIFNICQIMNDFAPRADAALIMRDIRCLMEASDDSDGLIYY